MFHKNVLSASPEHLPLQKSSGLSLVPNSSKRVPVTAKPSAVVDLVLIAARRSSSFFAEAAVLVLVFGILDYFMLKGRIELAWIAGAFTLSVALLAASIALDFSTHRWTRAHP
jgi:hypothetical protein